MIGFLCYSVISKMNFDSQEVISSYSLNEISLSNTPSMRKLIYKRRKIRYSRIEMSKQLDYSKHPRMVYIVKEQVYHAYI